MALSNRDLSCCREAIAHNQQIAKHFHAGPARSSATSMIPVKEETATGIVPFRSADGQLANSPLTKVLFHFDTHRLDLAGIGSGNFVAQAAGDPVGDLLGGGIRDRQ